MLQKCLLLVAIPVLGSKLSRKLRHEQSVNQHSINPSERALFPLPYMIHAVLLTWRMYSCPNRLIISD